MVIHMWSQLRHKLVCAANAQLNVRKRAVQAAPAVISSLRAELASLLSTQLCLTWSFYSVNHFALVFPVTLVRLGSERDSRVAFCRRTPLQQNGGGTTNWS